MNKIYDGKHFLSDSIYRAADGLANSDALMIENNPSDYIWSKKAPRDNRKATTMDIGTALHAAILEPEKYKDSIVVSSVKGRETKKFKEEQDLNGGKIVLTDDERIHIDFMCKSVFAHPSAADMLAIKGDCESSIFVKDKQTGVYLKCRPDKDMVESGGVVLDVKTTASLDDWRSDKPWINPLYKFNYGHQASFYTDVMQQHYGCDIETFVFLVIQKNIKLGRYPVGVFQITKDELIDLGFWGEHRANIDKFKQCCNENDWSHAESFNFAQKDDESFSNDDIVVEFEEDNK